MSMRSENEAGEDSELTSVCAEIDDETMLLDTGYENAMNFLNVWNSCRSVKEFLNRNEYISVRGTTVRAVEFAECLQLETDVDGICIEWLDIGEGLKSNFTHVQLESRDNNIRRIYPMLKKHLDLSKYNKNSLKVLRASVGYQILYDGGWETWVGYIPIKELMSTQVFDESDQKRICKAALERVRGHFQEQLKNLLHYRIGIKTLAKNNLNDASKVFVLPDDRRTILQALKRALDETDLPEGFETIVFSFRFGDKSVMPIDLPIADYSAVTDVTVHVACSITSDEFDLFWSRHGILEIVGGRGVITTAFSFKECANYQSNLDGRCMDISAALRSISRFENIHFLQLYSDIPHRYPKSRLHPVTGSVLKLHGLGNALAQESLYRDASRYLSEIENNFQQLVNGVCRLEYVLSLSTSGFDHQTITGTDFVQVERLVDLLERHPLIVPYMKEMKLMEKLKTIGIDLHGQLQSAYTTARGTGDIDKVWECYQIELAVEKLLWGHPFCSASRIYSINLGPGVQYPSRCLSDMMGFLCLSNTFACCSSENSLPPLQIFSQNPTVQRQLINASGITNLVGRSNVVLGRRVVECLLKDFHAIGTVLARENEFLVSLKSEARISNKRIVGRITVTELISRLKNNVKTRFPMVFGAVMKLLQASATDIDIILKSGLRDLGLGFFPAFRQHDENRNAYLTWRHKYGYWVISDVCDNNLNTEVEAEEMHGLVLSEMEKRKLCHTAMYRDSESAFPWLKPVLVKIAEKNLTVDQKVQILTFISCIALCQSGRYVNFMALSTLERKLPLSQRTLVALEVQCRFILVGVNTVRIHRLHASIPRSLDLKRQHGEASVNKDVESRPVDIQLPVEHAYVTERIMEDENEIEVSEIAEEEQVSVLHYATSRGCMKWSPQEIAIIMDVLNTKDQTLFMKFQAYQKRCREESIPDRSWPAFKRKLLRLKQTQ